MLMLYFVSCAVVFDLSGSQVFQNASYTTTSMVPEKDKGTSHSHMTTQDHMNNISCPALETLEFLHYNKSNKTEVQELEDEWPCEVRVYWSSPNIQDLASVVRFLFHYPVMALIVIGLVVNVYSLFVLNSPPINKCNMAVYLKALAVADIGVLLLNVTLGVLRAKITAINNIYIKYKWMCDVHKVHHSLFYYYSIWIVVAFTFERLLMIRNPFKIHTWHNKKPAKITVVILAVLMLNVAIIRAITTPGFENDSVFGYASCEQNSHGNISTNMIFFVLINSIIPSIFIIFGNVCLLIHIQLSAQNHKKLNASDDPAHTVKITRMLLGISLAYVILFLPFGVTSSAELLHKTNKPARENHALYIVWAKKIIVLKLIRRLCSFLYVLIYVNNFFLYCLSGDIFRQAVKRCLPSYLHKISSCFTIRQSPTKTKAPAHALPRRITPDSLTSQKTRGSALSSRRNALHSSTVSDTGYHNAVFSISEEGTQMK